MPAARRLRDQRREGDRRRQPSGAHVIRTVGPVRNGGVHREDELLASCHRRSLELAVELGCGTVASRPSRPASTASRPSGPAGIALRTTAEQLDRHETIERVTFVLFSESHLRTFEEALAELRGG